MVHDDTMIDETALDSVLRDLLGYVLKRSSNLVTADAARVLEPVGLRITTYSALSVIVQTPGVTQTQLAAALSMERSNTVAILDALEKAHLIEKRRSDTDRRALALHPTQIGQLKQRQATLVLRNHEDRMFEDLSPIDRRTLVALLSRIKP